MKKTIIDKIPGIAAELANACVPSAESELPLAPVGRAVLVGVAQDRIKGVLRDVVAQAWYEDRQGLRSMPSEIAQSPEIRQTLEEIMLEALRDPKDVLEDPRGMDVLLDAIVCTFRDAWGQKARVMSDQEAFEFVQQIYQEHGITPALRKAYEEYEAWTKETGHEL